MKNLYVVTEKYTICLLSRKWFAEFSVYKPWCSRQTYLKAKC